MSLGGKVAARMTDRPSEGQRKIYKITTKKATAHHQQNNKTRKQHLFYYLLAYNIIINSIIIPQCCQEYIVSHLLTSRKTVSLAQIQMNQMKVTFSMPITIS
jgi:hypothetical protein